MKVSRDTDNWYYNAIKQTEYFVKCAKSPLEKVRAFNYAMYVVRAEYISYTKARIFHKEFPHVIPNLFPCEYCNENGTKFTLEKEENQRKIPLSDNVAVTAWSIDRIAKNLPVIYKNGFVPDNNHKANYYTEIELTTVYNGNHSTSSGIFCKSGYIYADVFDISKLFQHVDTDGLNWINRHTKKKLTEVTDIHIAVLYEIARMKWDYLSGFDMDTADYLCAHAEIFRKDIDYYTVVGGIAGTGKSSFIGAMNANSLHGGFFLPPDYNAHELDLLFEKHENIIEESLLIMGKTIMRVREAKKHRYFVKMYYIGLDSADECIKRAKNNPSSREIDEQFIGYSFENRFKHLFTILPYCDEVDFYDNGNGFKKVAEFRGRDILPTGDAYPSWFVEMQTQFLTSYNNIFRD